MNDDQAVLPFEDSSRLIRRQWYNERWYFSVVDVIAILTEAQIPRNYWSDLKRRLADDEGFSELHAKIVQLKMRSLDGKRYATDAADTETLLRIIQSVPSPRAEPFKQWLAKVGAERLEDLAQSDLLAGMTSEQKAIFLRGQMADRNLSLADAASVVGVVTKRDFAIFQDHSYRGLYGGETARDIAARKGLAKGQQILDWMGRMNWQRISSARARRSRNCGARRFRAKRRRTKPTTTLAEQSEHSSPSRATHHRTSCRRPT